MKLVPFRSMLSIKNNGAASLTVINGQGELVAFKHSRYQHTITIIVVLRAYPSKKG